MAKYSNSSLATYTRIAPRCNGYGARTEDIIFFTPHCVVGQATAERIAEIFADPKRGASSNYGIGKDGKIALIVEEKDAAGTSSSRWNDERAITVECASDLNSPWAFKAIVYQRLVDLLVDVCKRNGKDKVLYLGTLAKTKSYLSSRKSNEMLLTEHRWYASTACPGTWMHDRMQQLADDANKALGGQPAPTPTPTKELYRVRKSWDDSKSQKGAFKNLDNAKKCCDEYAGYSVFDSNGKAVYTSGGKVIEGYTIGATYTTIPVSGLNVRTKPSIKAPLAGNALKKGTKVTCEDVVKDGNYVWMKVGANKYACAKIGSKVYIA